MDPQLYSDGWTRISPWELSASDDVATALVLDPMLGFITMKMSSTHLPDIQCFTAIKETLLSFQRTQDFIGTVDTLICKLGDYFRSLGSNHKELLKRHMYCYLKAFLSDSGLRIEATKRYSTGSNEAKVTSTRKLLVGQRVDGLVGFLADIGPNDKSFIKVGINDFSLMHSIRKKCDQLLLGPVRFVNHDCNANCKYVSQGKSVYVEVIKPISAGEELTCYYGLNFFGKKNEYCDYLTCEINGRGHGQRKPCDEGKFIYFS